MPPRQVVPTIQALAANAVMAGCKPEYFPVATAAMRGVLDPEYNLHGTLATTHSCAPMVMVSGPIRHELNINCGSNCFGQGWQANATIGRALGLMLLNVAGAKPGEMDRSTQGNPAKYTFCFGENEEENPWTPYHVQRGFAPTDSVVTVMSGEGPHNLNDHGSTTGDRPADDLRRRHGDPRRQHGLRQGPDVRHHRPRACRDPQARRLHDRQIREELWKRSRVHLSRISAENLDTYISTGHKPDGDWLHHRPLAGRHPHHRGRRPGQALGVHPVVRRHDRRLGAHRQMSEWCGWPVVDESTGWEAAQQILTDAELSDGLPLVPPTQRRLDAMVAGIASRTDSHGMMPPMFGDITPESVAYQCVIAGARPAELPVVLAAAEATLEPDFNLLGIATTTGTACVALCVHGPIARQLGINAGTNCLGPGNRANASIGRALQLCIRNIGGARSDVGDMATMGQPGKYTLCFAERNDGPFPTLTERHGLGKDASAITVMGISGTAEVLPGDGEGATPEAILSPIVAGMKAALVMSGIEPQERARRAGLPAAARDGREDRPPRRLGYRTRAALRVRAGRRRRPRARGDPSDRHRRRRLQDELPADLGRRLADGDAQALTAGGARLQHDQIFHPIHSQTPRPITPSRSRP